MFQLFNILAFCIIIISFRINAAFPSKYYNISLSSKANGINNQIVISFSVFSYNSTYKSFIIHSYFSKYMTVGLVVVD